MTVNGKQYPYRDGLTLHTLLAELAVKTEQVVVMHGEEIHRPGTVPDTPLAERDVVEVVTMMAGG
jgi:thiamine biosynthesis protein ThiS